VSAGRGFIIVISGPSGAGKGTIAEGALKRFPWLSRSVSATTRAPRAGEIAGEHKMFKSPSEFSAMVERGELLEWTTYLDHSYGTPRAQIDQRLAAGRSVLCDVDIVGARYIKAAYPDAVLVFVVPPSWEMLAARLTARQSETPEALARRLALAHREIEAVDDYDYVIVNDRVDDAIDLLCAIIRAEQARSSRTDLGYLRERARTTR